MLKGLARFGSGTETIDLYFPRGGFPVQRRLAQVVSSLDLVVHKNAHFPTFFFAKCW
jgi:hypothetical protein